MKIFVGVAYFNFNKFNSLSEHLRSGTSPSGKGRRFLAPCPLHLYHQELTMSGAGSVKLLVVSQQGTERGRYSVPEGDEPEQAILL